VVSKRFSKFASVLAKILTFTWACLSFQMVMAAHIVKTLL